MALTVAVAVMAKEPAPGRVKTRLCPPLSLQEAADLSRAFLLDKIAQLDRLEGASPYLAYTPPEAEGYFRRLAGPRIHLLTQADGILGTRLDCLARDLLCRGHAGVVIIGTDSPNLPDAHLAAAVRCLRTAAVDVVLGPSEDGGYYLVGLRRPAPRLFEEIAWGTIGVLEQTLAQASGAGLSVRLLDPWFDVDTSADLVRLQAELASAPHRCPWTAAFLARHP